MRGELNALYILRLKNFLILFHVLRLSIFSAFFFCINYNVMVCLLVYTFLRKFFLSLFQQKMHKRERKLICGNDK